METVQRLDVGRWLLDKPVHVAAYSSLGRGIRALPSKSYLAPPMDERDRAAGAMGQPCAALFAPRIRALKCQTTLSNTVRPANQSPDVHAGYPAQEGCTAFSLGCVRSGGPARHSVPVIRVLTRYVQGEFCGQLMLHG